MNHWPVDSSRSTAMTSNPVTMRTPEAYRSSTRRSDSWFMPPTIPATCEPAGAAERKACAAAERERCLRKASRRPGMVASTSSLSGWVEYTPETTGATRLSSTFWPMRMRTSSPRVFAFSPAETGRNLSTWARRRPFLPMTGISDLSFTLPGMPMMPVLGVRRAPCGRYSHEP